MKSILIPQTGQERVSARITPANSRAHQDLESDVETFLHLLGFLTDSATYHDVMKPEIVSILQRIHDPTAFYVRSRADRVAVHPEYRFTFEWECKTPASARHPNMAVEALPLATHHLLGVRLYIKCLYIYRDPYRKLDIGFWSDKLPRIAKLFVPTSKWDDLALEWFSYELGEYFDLDPILLDENYGSGDPFVVIEEEDLLGLPHWKHAIADWLAHFQE